MDVDTCGVTAVLVTVSHCLQHSDMLPSIKVYMLVRKYSIRIGHKRSFHGFFVLAQHKLQLILPYLSSLYEDDLAHFVV